MSGKIAVVTGAGSGIGRASALALLNNGYKVALAGRRKDALDETAKMAGNNTPNAMAVPTDVTKRDDIVALFAKVKATFGRLDLVFNNAGGGAPPVPLEELPYETWLNVVAANLTGQYGVKDLYVGVPVVLGAKGVERIVEIELTGAEQSMFDKSVDSVGGLVDACMKIAPNLG